MDSIFPPRRLRMSVEKGKKMSKSQVYVYKDTEEKYVQT